MNTENAPTQTPASTTTGTSPEKPMKKRSLFKIVLIVIGVLIVLSIIGGIAQKAKNPEAQNNTATTTNSTQNGGQTSGATNTRGTNNIVIGLEYAFPGTETAFKELGIPAIKFYPEDYYQWDKMQKGPNDPIDYSKLDDMVRRYQNAGMTNILVGLRYDSRWAAKDGGKVLNRTNGIPKPEFQAAYEKWLTGIVERYDADGKDDMPGLKAAITQYEIGVEYSSYVPEPADQYVPFLQRSYDVAHAAFPNVRIGHAAFLTTNIFANRPGASDYARLFNSISPAGSGMKRYADVTAILDKPSAFDFINLHAIADPTEIDGMVAWAKYEMNKRGYTKPIIISDTSTNPYIAWGRANTCTGGLKGAMVHPATEADRCRISSYFSKLIANDSTAVAYVRAISAEDVAKKIIIAAANGVERIDSAFTEDIEILKGLTGAGSGNAGWGGVVDVSRNILTQERTVKAKFPAFYALKQTQAALKKYDSIERLSTNNSDVRLYKVVNGNTVSWIAWLEPTKVVLPGETVPTATTAIPGTTGTLTATKLITKMNQSSPEQTAVNANAVTLTPTPVFLTK